MHNGCHLLSTYYMPVSVDKDRGSEGKKEKEKEELPSGPVLCAQGKSCWRQAESGSW